MARQITFSFPHRHSQAEVKSRLVDAIAEARAKHPTLLAGAQETWSGDRMDFRLNVMGQTVTGDVMIDAEQVHLHVNLPFVLAMLADKIRPRIEAEGRKLLDAPRDKR